MRRFSALTAIATSLVALALGMVSPLAFAADATPGGVGQALEIAPPILTLNADPGQTITAKIQLRDITASPLVVTNQINDFVANGEDGTPKILTGQDANNPFSLQNWIAPLAAFTLQPRQIETLNVTINVPANASPGGHYGVIRFTGTPPELNGTGVSLSASLGALVLLTVNGKLTHSLSLIEFSASNKAGKATTLFQSAPLDFLVRLKNSGNIQEQPAGKIVVSDMFGKAVASINVNLPPHNILPNSIRKFTGSLDRTNLGNRRLFGLYHATLVVTYGSKDAAKTLSARTNFWVIPWRLILIIVALIIGGFFGLRYLIKRYNRFIISRVQGGSAPAKSKARKRSGRR